MLIAAIIAICVLLLVLGFLLPRFSWFPQRGVDRAAGTGQRTAGKAPGPLGRWLQRPFRTGREAADESARTGRRARGKLPF
jgi:hypothetical protein